MRVIRTISMDETTQTLEHEKETKNTHRFQAEENGEPPVVDKLYLPKWYVGENPPERIEITVAETDGEAA